MSNLAKLPVSTPTTDPALFQTATHTNFLLGHQWDSLSHVLRYHQLVVNDELNEERSTSETGKLSR